MACISPYRIDVRAVAGETFFGGRHLVYGISSDVATDELFRVRFKILTRTKRRELIVASRARALRLYAWRCLIVASPNAPSWFMHALDREEARGMGRDALGMPDDTFIIEPADDLQVLWSLSDAEIDWNCLYVWSGRGARSELRHRVPLISYRRQRGVSGRRPMTASTRALGIYALRLAQDVPAMGSDLGHTWNKNTPRWRSNNLTHKDKPLTGRAVKLHGETVSPAVLRECFEAGFDRPLEPFTRPQRDALLRLGRAYGYDVEGMSLWQLHFLWEYGAGALEQR